MAFRTPNFNVWAQVWRPDAGAVLHSIGYSKCQFRGPTSHAELTGAIAFEILFPKFTDIRDIVRSEDGFADVIAIAGWGRRYAVVQGVSDKGAGFGNEYRLCVCGWRPRTAILPPVPPGQPPIDTTEQPPAGFPTVPLITPVAWVNPPT